MRTGRRGPVSLRTRLIISVGAVVLTIVAAAFAVVYHQTDSQLGAQLDREIQSDAHELALEMDAHPDGSPSVVLRRARAFVASQPYQDAAVLLFALAPGYGTASNHPELVTPAIPDAGADADADADETQRQQSVENAEAAQIATPRPGYSTNVGPDVGMLRIYEEPLRVAHGVRVYAGAAEPLADTRRAVAEVAHSFELAGVLALVLSLGFAYLIGTRVSAPLRTTATLAALIDAGDLTPRLHPPDHASSELLVLADAFNHMLDRLAAAFASQREFIADASHELRTPVTVIRGQLDLLAATNADALRTGSAPVSPEELARVERLVQAEIARMTRLTDDLLLLAQSDQANFLQLQAVEIVPFITDLWDGLTLMAQRRFEVGELPVLTVMADPDRLAQALRNLGLNAVNHTQAPDGLVRIDVRAVPGRSLRITVSDDGPGVPSAQRHRVFERFFRTDPARERARGGAGLGLAIVKAIATAHGGDVQVGESATGGASFELTLPLQDGPAVAARS
jgi:two-component system OmpR family sensor kinase